MMNYRLPFVLSLSKDRLHAPFILRQAQHERCWGGGGMSIPGTYVILNLFQDNKINQSVMLKQVQHDEYGGVCA